MKIKGGIASKGEAIVGSDGRVQVDIAGVTEPNYATSESSTGVRWIDGKTIFRKVVDLGTMPGAGGSFTVPHGITGLDTILFMHGGTKDPVGVFWFPLPYPDDAGGKIEIDMENADIEVSSGHNRTSFTDSHIILYYTKS